MKIGVIIPFLFLLFSCSSPYIEKKEISVDSFSRGDTLRYSFALEMNVDYAADLMIQHNTEYTYQNLYLLIISEGPDKSIQRDTFSIQLAGEDGYWLGECRNNSCSISSLLFPRFSFAEPGQWTVSITQFSRNEQVNNLKKIGLGLKLD